MRRKHKKKSGDFQCERLKWNSVTGINRAYNFIHKTHKNGIDEWFRNCQTSSWYVKSFDLIVLLWLRFILFGFFSSSSKCGEHSQCVDYSAKTVAIYKAQFFSRLFLLGYLQIPRTDEKAWNKLALEYCKLNKAYLREEYNLLSHGIKVKYVNNTRTLIDIIREFIEIEEIGTYR